MHILSTFLILAWLASCAPETDEGAPISPSIESETILDDDSVDLSIERLIRRASLDTTGHLPELADTNAVVSTPNRLPYIISNYVKSKQHSDYISRYFQHVWGLSKHHLPDLERHINQGDSSLANELTDAMRSKISAEASYLLKSVIDHNRTMKSLFFTNFALGDNELLNFWSLNGTRPAWLGTDILYANYADGRPSAGLLSNQSFLAHFDSREQSIPYTRTYEIIKTLTCISHSDPEAHRFTDIEPADISESLRAISVKRKRCASCHTNYHHVAHLFSGLATGTSFGDFSSYEATSTTLTTRFLGRDISSLEEMAQLVANNPSMYRCQIKRLMESLMQKMDSDEFTTDTLNAVYDAFASGQFKLNKIMPAFIQSEIYRLGPFHKKSSSRAAKQLSGLRFLNKIQWQMIVKQLGYEPNDFEISDDLFLSTFELGEHRSFFPQTIYWQATKRLGEQLASAIVNNELTSDQSRGRELLMELHDDYEKSTGDQISAQITALVRRLTSVYNNDEFIKLHADLLKLWKKSGGTENTAQSHKTAWEIILRAIFLSPQFITY